MKLKEFEGMQLFEKAGIPIAKRTLVTNVKEIPQVDEEVVVKVQTLAGGRGKAGGVKFCKPEKVEEQVRKFLGKEILGEKVTEVLIQQKFDKAGEYYLGFMFDTRLRSPVLIISKEGGVDIEEIKEKSPDKVTIEEIDAMEGLTNKQAIKAAKKAGLNEKVAEVAVKLYDCFKSNDMRMVEINPLIETSQGKLFAADAVVVLDDDGLKRHDFTFPERTANREKTPREIRANAIDKENHKGIAGKTFIDIGGDIGVLSIGGGASVTAMDALLTYGATLSNFTEYSGNPPAEKVEKLTRVVLEPDNLCGLFIVGGRANFTRVDITLGASLKVLIEKKIDFPIVVRRAGPYYEEALELFRKEGKKHNLNVKVYDDSVPITVAAKEMAELAAEYKRKKK